jgi:hypothetical protein
LKAKDGTDEIPATTALAGGALASFFEPIGPLVSAPLRAGKAS